VRKIWILLLSIILLFAACTSTAKKWQEQYDLGMRFLSEGNYEEAIIAFNAAIEIDDKNVAAYIGRGDVYYSMENMELAAADYEKALEFDDMAVEIYLKLSDIYFNMGDIDATIAILEKGYEKTGNEDILAKLKVFRGESDDMSMFLTDNMMTVDDITIGGKPFYTLTIEEAVKLIPVGENDMVEFFDSYGKGILIYPDGSVDKYYGTSMMTSQISLIRSTGVYGADVWRAESNGQTIEDIMVSYGDEFPGFETGIRGIKLGDTLEEVLVELGVSEKGAEIIVATNKEMTISESRIDLHNEDRGNIGQMDIIWVSSLAHIQFTFINGRLDCASVRVNP